MKYLSDYTKQLQTELFNRTGSFFAFSNKQYEEQAKPDEKYIWFSDAGLFCPEHHAEELTTEMANIHAQGIKQDIEENGVKNIIWREFANYECQLTNNYGMVLGALQDYPITEEQIKEQWKPYFRHCVENDLF